MFHILFHSFFHRYAFKGVSHNILLFSHRYDLKSVSHIVLLFSDWYRLMNVSHDIALHFFFKFSFKVVLTYCFTLFATGVC